MDAIIRLLL